MVSGLIFGRLEMSFMSPVQMAGTGGVSDWCEVVRLWWGSEPSFTLLLSHKDEVPIGREQLAGRHMPTYTTMFCSHV